MKLPWYERVHLLWIYPLLASFFFGVFLVNVGFLGWVHSATNDVILWLKEARDYLVFMLTIRTH